MPFLLLFWFIFFNHQTGNSQSLLRESSIFENKNRFKTYSLLSKKNESFAILRFSDDMKRNEIILLNEDLTLKSKNMGCEQIRNYAGALNINDNLFFIYSQFKENKTLEQYEQVSLWLNRIDTHLMTCNSDSFALIAPFTLKAPLYKGNLSISEDHSKIVVFDYEEEGDVEGVEGLTEEIRLRVFDKHFHLLWSRKVDLTTHSAGRRMIAVQKVKVNNSGEVAILTDQFRTIRSYQLKEVSCDPTLFFIGSEKNQILKFTPQLGDFFFNQSDIQFDKNNNLLWLGCFSEEKYHQQKGYYFIKIAADKSKVLERKIVPFAKEDLEILCSKKTKEADHLKLIHFKINEQDEIILSFERQPYSTHFLKSHSLYILSILPNGNLKWAHPHYKYNSFKYSLQPFLSHYVINSSNYTHILFNQGLYKEGGKACLLTIEKEGKARQTTLFEYQNQETILCPLQSFQLSENKVLLSFQSEFFNKFQFGILDLTLPNNE